MSSTIDQLRQRLALAEDEIFRVEMADDMAATSGSLRSATLVRDALKRELDQAIAKQETPGRLRNRIDVLEQFLKQAHPDSQEAWRLHQRLAETGRQLAALEDQGAIDVTLVIGGQISATETASKIEEINHEWRIVAFRQNGDGNWQWNITPIEARVLREMVADGAMICTQRRDHDGTRLFCKLPKEHTS